MIRTLVLATLAAGPALAHSGHAAPASHTHLEEIAAVAVATLIAYAAFRAWRAR